MKQEVKQGQADYTILILVRDTDGAPKTGLTNASGGIDVSYTRVETDNDVTITAGAVVALASPALTDPHLDWGFLEVDATNAPGIYRFDMADGVFAAGAWSSVVTLIATGVDPTHIEFVLTPALPYDGVNVSAWLGSAVTLSTGNKPDVNVNEISDDATAADNLELAADNYSVTRGLTGTALPAAVADAAGGLPISDAGGKDIDNIPGATTVLDTLTMQQILAGLAAVVLGVTTGDGTVFEDRSETWERVTVTADPQANRDPIVLDWTGLPSVP